MVNRFSPAPIDNSDHNSYPWKEWYRIVDDLNRDALEGNIAWSRLNLDGSEHNSLGGIQGGLVSERFHLSSAAETALRNSASGTQVTALGTISYSRAGEVVSVHLEVVSGVLLVPISTPLPSSKYGSVEIWDTITNLSLGRFFIKNNQILLPSITLTNTSVITGQYFI